MGDANSIVIAGIAEGLGLALAETFAGEGYDVIGLARSARVAEIADERVSALGRDYHHLEVDLRLPQNVQAALAPHAGRVNAGIVIAQRFLRAPFLETSADDFADAFATNCAGAANVARALLPAMVSRGSGTLVFTGATASLRGGASFPALSASKFALRALAQSLSREFGPRGIHIAHLVIDGPIDCPQTETRFPGRTDTRMDTLSVARTCLMLAKQTPDAFTQELDLRHAMERF